MRVLVTGAHGQVGQELIARAPEGFVVVGLGSDELDIRDQSQVEETVGRLTPALIINAAAYTAVDKAESEPGQAWAVNCDGTGHLARAAEQLGIPVLHISTDYVFPGDAQSPYLETDATGPTGVYGASKLAGEELLARLCSRHIILRTSWVFGAHGHNFVKTMLRLGANQERLRVVGDQQGGPTPATDIADALWTLAQQYQRQGSLHWGVYHFCGSPSCSWFDFAQEIFRQAQSLGILPHASQLQAISTEQYPLPARRPAWSVLDTGKLARTYGIQSPDWRQGLRHMLRAIAHD